MEPSQRTRVLVVSVPCHVGTHGAYLAFPDILPPRLTAWNPSMKTIPRIGSGTPFNTGSAICTSGGLAAAGSLAAAVAYVIRRRR